MTRLRNYIRGVQICGHTAQYSGHWETGPVPLFIKHLGWKMGKAEALVSGGPPRMGFTHKNPNSQVSVEGHWGMWGFSQCIPKWLWLTEGFEIICCEILCAAPNEDPQLTDQEMGSENEKTYPKSQLGNRRSYIQTLVCPPQSHASDPTEKQGWDPPDHREPIYLFCTSGTSYFALAMHQVLTPRVQRFHHHLT